MKKKIGIIVLCLEIVAIWVFAFLWGFAHFKAWNMAAVATIITLSTAFPLKVKESERVVSINNLLVVVIGLVSLFLGLHWVIMWTMIIGVRACREFVILGTKADTVSVTAFLLFSLIYLVAAAVPAWIAHEIVSF